MNTLNYFIFYIIGLKYNSFHIFYWMPEDLWADSISYAFIFPLALL